MQVHLTQITDRKGLTRFIKLPLALYKDDPLYVPHLISERRRFFSPANPLFEFTEVAYFLASDGRGRPVGRITAHINRRHNEFWNERTGFFGFFESVDDAEVARALLSAAEDWLRERGMERIRGPFNFSTNEECGLLVEGFERPPAVMMPYNKRYYPRLLEWLGLRKVKDLYAYEYAWRGEIPPHLTRFAERVRDRLGVVVRPVRVDQFEQEVRRAFAVYNRAWERNWGFIPMTEAEFDYMARELKPVVVPELALIAEVEGEVVGFSLALPDINPILKKMKGRLLPFGVFHWLLGRRRLNKVRVLTMGVVPEHRRRGVDVLLIYYCFANGVPMGFHYGEFSWVLEDNELMIRALERMGAERTKVYRIYEKPL